MKRKAKIEAVPPVASIEEHKAAKSATLTELETLRIKAAVARLRELDATVANLSTQLQQARIARQQQGAICKGMRDEILTVYGFDPADQALEVEEKPESITIRKKA